MTVTLRSWHAEISQSKADDRIQKTATVEAATLVLGVSSVTDAYQRAGVGRTGRRSDRGVRWTPLAPRLPA